MTYRAIEDKDTRMAINHEYTCDRPNCRGIQMNDLSHPNYPPGWGQLQVQVRDANNELYEARLDLCPADLKVVIDQFCGSEHWRAGQMPTDEPPDLDFSPRKKRK